MLFERRRNAVRVLEDRSARRGGPRLYLERHQEFRSARLRRSEGADAYAADNLRRRRDVTRSTEVVLGSFVEDALLDIGMLHSGVRLLVGLGREISKG